MAEQTVAILHLCKTLAKITKFSRTVIHNYMPLQHANVLQIKYDTIIVSKQLIQFKKFV